MMSANVSGSDRVRTTSSSLLSNNRSCASLLSSRPTMVDVPKPGEAMAPPVQSPDDPQGRSEVSPNDTDQVGCSKDEAPNAMEADKNSDLASCPNGDTSRAMEANKNSDPNGEAPNTMEENNNTTSTWSERQLEPRAPSPTSSTRAEPGSVRGGRATPNVRFVPGKSEKGERRENERNSRHKYQQSDRGRPQNDKGLEGIGTKFPETSQSQAAYPRFPYPGVLDIEEDN